MIEENKCCATCDHCKEHKYVYACKLGRATECTWENDFKLWFPVQPKHIAADFIEEEEMII